MGYRSDVGLALTRNGVKTMVSMLKKEPPAVKKAVKDFLRYAESHSRDTKTGAHLWIWGSVKWYEFDPQSFPEVDFFERLKDELDDKDFYYVWIGDDYEDIGYRGDFWDNPFDLYITRRLHFLNAA